MSISQIGNGDLPLNNCAILQKVLKPEQLDFIQTFLRGDALINPIQQLSAGVKGAIGDAIGNIGSLPLAGTNPDGTASLGYSEPFINGLVTQLSNFETDLVDFEQRTNRMSGVVSGFQDGEPDLGRILGVGSAYNSALATLATNPEEILKDNFSHGFNSLKKEFGVDAIQQSDGVLETINNLLAEVGTGYPGNIPAAEFVNKMQQITGSLSTIQQSIVNITTAEDAFLSGALAFLDKYALANTALSGVLADPCLIGKVFTDLIASPDLDSLLPSLQLPSLPSLDEITSAIPNPEDIGNAIKESVEGIVESIEQQVEQLIDDAAKAGKELVEGIQKTAEELVASGEALVEMAEQAASDLAENVEEFGRDVDTFFANLQEESSDEEGEDQDSITEEVTPNNTTIFETTGGIEDGTPSIIPPPPPQTQAEETRYESNTVVILYRQAVRQGIEGSRQEWLADNFSREQLEEAYEYADYQGLVDRDYNSLGPNRSMIRDALQIQENEII